MKDVNTFHVECSVCSDVSLELKMKEEKGREGEERRVMLQ